MPSLQYHSLLNLVSPYLTPQKAAEVIARQLVACNLNPDTLSGADLKTAASRLSIACGLYVSEPSKRDELKNKLLAL